MKSPVNKNILAILILAVFIAGAVSCSEDEKPDLYIVSPDETLAPQNENPILKIYCWNISKGTEQDTFTDLVWKEFGVELQIVRQRIKFPLTPEAKKLDGLVVYGWSPLDSKGSRDEYFYSLNSILEENETFNSLPKQLIESIKDENGIMWYLPLGHRFSFERRFYHADAIDRNGYKVPDTLDEFLELLITVKKDYSKQLDYNVMYLNKRTCVTQLHDIAKCYGMMTLDTGSVETMILGWNEHNNRFEDSFAGSDIFGFLTAIRYLTENQIISTDMTLLDPVDNIWRENEAGRLFTFAGSTQGVAYTKYMSGPFLDDTVEYTFNDYNKHLYVPFNVEDPKEKLNTFIDTFLATSKGNIIGYYGESGWNVKYNDQYRVVNILPPEEKKLLPESNVPYFIGLVNPWFNNSWDIYTKNRTLEENQKMNERVKAFKADIRKGFEDGSIVVLPAHKVLNLGTPTRLNPPDTENGGTIMWTASKLFGDMLYEFINSTMGMDEFEEEYIKNMKKMGVEEFLNQQNEKIPGAGRFSYGD